MTWEIVQVESIGNEYIALSDGTYRFVENPITHDGYRVGQSVAVKCDPYTGMKYVILEDDYSFFMAFYEVQKLSHTQYIYWYVVPKSFWSENKYIPDWELYMNIPNMINTGGHCYELEYSEEQWTLEQQIEHMQNLGFGVVPLLKTT